MNQIDLILENIRLGHINQLMLEATTPDEVNRGVALINESMQTVYGVLQEAYYDDNGRYNNVYHDTTGYVGDTNSSLRKNGLREAKINARAGAGLGAGAGILLGSALGGALGDNVDDVVIGAGLGGVAGASTGSGTLAGYGNELTNRRIRDASKTRANNVKAGLNPDGTVPPRTRPNHLNIHNINKN
jgi:hypothetical protein